MILWAMATDVAAAQMRSAMMLATSTATAKVALALASAAAALILDCNLVWQLSYANRDRAGRCSNSCKRRHCRDHHIRR